MKKLIIFFFLFTTSFFGQSPQYKLIVFEGSDWCVNCLKLEKQVLKTSTFKNYLAKKNISIQKVDFPQRTKQSKEQKQQNKLLAKKYAFKGVFPTLVLINENNDKVVTLESKKTETLIQEIDKQIQKQ